MHSISFTFHTQKLMIPFKAKKESLSDAYHNSLYADKWWFLFQEKHCMWFLIAPLFDRIVWFSFLCQQITSLNCHLESWSLPSRFLLCLTSLTALTAETSFKTILIYFGFVLVWGGETPSLFITAADRWRLYHVMLGNFSVAKHLL